MGICGGQGRGLLGHVFATASPHTCATETLCTRIRSVERSICPIAAVCTVLLSRSRDPGHANVSETFVRCHAGTIPGNTPAKFEVRIAVLELLAFNAQKFTGSRDSGHAPFYPILTFRGWRPPRHVV